MFYSDSLEVPYRHIHLASGAMSTNSSGACKDAKPACLSDDVVVVMRHILRERSNPEIVQLAKKLYKQGIFKCSKLKLLSKNLIEQKLSEQQVDLGEVADILEVWTALQKSSKSDSHFLDSELEDHAAVADDTSSVARGQGSGGSQGSPEGDNSKSARERSRSPRNRADDDDDSWGSWHHDGRRSEKVVGLVPLASVKGSVGLQQRQTPPSCLPPSLPRRGLQATQPCVSPQAARYRLQGLPPPLWTAVVENDIDEVKRLHQTGGRAAIEMQHQRWTPLMVACERGFVDIASFLLENGADTSAVNGKGRCALSFAAAPSQDDQQNQRVSQLEIIELLSRHGAEIDRRDKMGKTPRDYAETDSRCPQTSDPCWQRAAAAELLAALENV